MYIALFVAILVAAIMFHEFGHFATAKAFGMKCEKFFLGFGPTLWSVRRGETEYGVKLLPAGGFVKIVGMSPYEETDPADAGRRFFEQPAWQRAIVLVSGSATHVVTAGLLVFLGLAAIGLPVATNTVAGVVEGSPAEEAGLTEGDRVLAVDGEATEGFEELSERVGARGGETVPITVERDGSIRTVEVAVAETTPEGREQGFLGVSPHRDNRPMSAGQAATNVVSGDYSIPRLASATVEGVVRTFTPSNLAAWVGSAEEGNERPQASPVSVVGIGDLISSFGQRGLLFGVFLILAHLNIVLGMANLLPLPPLDGGHLAVLVVEQAVNGTRRMLGRPSGWRLNPAVVTPVALAVILFFTALTVTAVYIDIVNPASNLLD